MLLSQTATGMTWWREPVPTRQCPGYATLLVYEEQLTGTCRTAVYDRWMTNWTPNQTWDCSFHQGPIS